MGVTRLRRSHVCVAAVDCGRHWVQRSLAKPRGKQNLAFGLCRVQFEGPGDCWDFWGEHVTCRPTVAASLSHGALEVTTCRGQGFVSWKVSRVTSVVRILKPRVQECTAAPLASPRNSAGPGG